MYNDKQDISGINIRYKSVNEKEELDIYPSDLSSDYSRKVLLKELKNRLPNVFIMESLKGVRFLEE